MNTAKTIEIDKDTHPGLSFFNELALQQQRSDKGWPVEHMAAIIEYLGEKAKALKVIQVGGTNGKGSTAAMVSAMLAGTGAKVVLSVSPHLETMNERIIIDGRPITDEHLNVVGCEVKRLAEEVGVELSYPTAHLVGAVVKAIEDLADWLVIEVSCGGRYDASTGIPSPKATSIVSVGRDHEDLLGEYPVQITREKAAIIRAGAPIVCGKMPEESVPIVKEAAAKVGSEVRMLGKDFRVESENGEVLVSFWDKERVAINLPLEGTFQRDNLAVALSILKVLGFNTRDLIEGISHVRWPGRFERIYFNSREWILDCAHNESAVNCLVESLERAKLKKVVLGFGAVQNKDWRSMLSKLLPFASEIHLVKPDSPKAVSTAEISEFASSSCTGSDIINSEVEVICHGGDYKAFIDAVSSEETDTPILLTGSVYLVGAVRALIAGSYFKIW